MAEHRQKDEPTGLETTGHEWDGIQELDRPLPRWWLIVFYASIVVAAVMWVLYPAWPGVTGATTGILHTTSRAEVMKDLQALQAQRGAEAHMLDNASLEQIEKDPKMQAYAMQVGSSIFGDNCAPCHGQGGTGGHGYPNLRDDVWLWGGTLEDIQHTITVGVRSGQTDARMSQMPAFGRDQMLKPGEVDDLTEYVVSLSHRQADSAAVARAAPIFAQQCSACHGVSGTGNQAMGAPNLTDADWLYGSDRASIRSQIWNGRGGVMPSWRARFSPSTIKALAVYVHANAGG
jgi:cytochrome c oxidase cbb3-type subunit 3